MVKCLWDFYTVWLTQMKHLHFIAIIEILFFMFLGVFIIKIQKKRNKKEIIRELFIMSVLTQAVVPPVEMFLTCYPFGIAFVKNLFLLFLLWLGVGIWFMFSKFQKTRKTKNKKRKKNVKKIGKK
jgi:4-hydroxybenzoate polyprenyltransferase